MRRARTLADRRGIALLLTVWLLAVLAVLVGEFIASGRVKVAAERNARARLEAYALALAGYRSALAALDKELAQLSRGGDDRLLLHYGRGAQGVPATREDVALGEGGFSWSIDVEDGKVNVNAAGRQVLANLLQACGLGPGAERDTITASIVDWRDAGRGKLMNGAEEEFYRALDPPYSCKDGPFTTLEELLLVNGIRENPKVFEGAEEAGSRVPGLRDLVTIYDVDWTQPQSKAVAPAAVLKALGQSRPARAVDASALQYFSVIAEGRPRGSELRRAIKAVVVRDATSPSTMDFRLVYWNDDYSSGPGREKEDR